MARSDGHEMSIKEKEHNGFKSTQLDSVAKAEISLRGSMYDGSSRCSTSFIPPP